MPLAAIESPSPQLCVSRCRAKVREPLADLVISNITLSDTTNYALDTGACGSTTSVEPGAYVTSVS